MSSSATNINFSFEYAVSIVVLLVVTNLLVKSSPQMNTVIVIIVGLVILTHYNMVDSRSMAVAMLVSLLGGVAQSFVVGFC
jgi:hypothetical protein